MDATAGDGAGAIGQRPSTTGGITGKLWWIVLRSLPVEVHASSENAKVIILEVSSLRTRPDKHETLRRGMQAQILFPEGKWHSLQEACADKPSPMGPTGREAIPSSPLPFGSRWHRQGAHMVMALPVHEKTYGGRTTEARRDCSSRRPASGTARQRETTSIQTIKTTS